MKPNEVDDDNEQHLRDTVYNYKRLEPTSSYLRSTAMISEGRKFKKLKRRKSKFRVGDYVRLSKYRTVFEKSYKPNFTTEIFKISKVQYNTDPITYLLVDYKNQNVLGSVYEEELQSVKHPDVYLVEKILRRKRGQVLVKWLGFGPEHNSWISESEVYD